MSKTQIEANAGNISAQYLKLTSSLITYVSDNRVCYILLNNQLVKIDPIGILSHEQDVL